MAKGLLHVQSLLTFAGGKLGQQMLERHQFNTLAANINSLFPEVTFEHFASPSRTNLSMISNLAFKQTLTKVIDPLIFFQLLKVSGIHCTTDIA